MKEKTWKREVAIGLLFVLFAFFIGGIWLDRCLEIAQYLTSPIFLFNGGAFGADTFAKQILNREKE
jgi:hypothetical protein